MKNLQSQSHTLDCIWHIRQGVGSTGHPLWWEARVCPGLDRRSQLAPTDPPQDTAEAFNKDGRASGKVWEKVQNATKAMTIEGKSMRNSCADTEDRERGGLGGGPGTGADTPSKPVDRTTPVQADISWRNYSLWRAHAGEGLTKRTAVHVKDLW